MFGVFHDAGYKGLYGGLGVDAIKARKGIAPKEQLMDRMNTFGRFSILFAGVISTRYITPAKRNENRLKRTQKSTEAELVDSL